MNEVNKFVVGWGKIRQNLIATAQDMAEEHYDQAPFDGIWSFRQQVGHILHVADVLFDGIARGEFDRSKFAADRYSGMTKQELLAAMESDFRSLSTALSGQPESYWSQPRKSFDGSDSSVGELLQMGKEHEIAHLNQLYLYLRAKGVVPPTTRKRAAAKAAASA